ncbi:hypothetical protein B9479_004583 [Cryptococcus floricola]|uniref:mRNA-capping enzyme subunit alpha n=1 Tax=Cryptococcus floricola TaxID=2591691 RepID=A0A5D3ATI5_9TREE|nr:hypothetical protein B9479_004583 [Cryptococcus floricola]
MPAHTPIPDIPGERLQNPETKYHLASRVSQLCGLNSPDKFPGSQPVSFSTASLDLLEKKDFWVCEKSDGVRVLVFIVINGFSGEQETWLIDRKQEFYNVKGLMFPKWDDRRQPLGESILDGELVIDVDPQRLRFYGFDCLVLNGENIMSKNLEKRYARLRDWVVVPLEKHIRDNPEAKQYLPFEVLAKREDLSYHLKYVMKEHIPKLQHGHDGLIFTCVQTPYVMGTDENILKWKPPSENSIDFRIELRFPPIHDSDEPDYHAKPEFCLHTWLGSERYEFFDFMEMTDEEWESWKESGKPLDDRIVEVNWDGAMQAWRMMRIRDDKLHGNHKSIVEKILVSINDGVEIEELYARSDAIKSAWKSRAAHPQTPAVQRPPPPQQHQTHGHGYGGGAGDYGGGDYGGGYGQGHGYGQGQAPQGVVAGLKR